MTTPRDEATALVEAALNRIVETATESWFRAEWDDAHALADGLLAASPTLAADLEFAAAWRRVERALPEGWALSSAWHDGGPLGWRFVASKRATTEKCDQGQRHVVPTKTKGADGLTPTAALTRLAETLEAMR